MGWARSLGYLWALVLVHSCKALEDVPDLGQHEVAFDLSELLATEDDSQLDIDMTQKEVTFDLDGLWEPIVFSEMDADMPDITQREVFFNPLRIQRERVSSYAGPDMTQREVGELHLDLTPRDPALFSPRSARPRNEKEFPFPPGRPTAANLRAICLHGDRRPRYPAGSLPSTGFSHLRRQGDAINRAESWYGVCCRRNGTQDEEVMLCCARQAWEQSLSAFCDDEFSIKTRHYHCCKEKPVVAKWDCFEKDAPNPSYQPATTQTPHPGANAKPQGPRFRWNPNTCKKSGSKGTAAPRGFKGRTTKVADISFPPGRPTAANIELVCRLRKLRPRYLPRCLPRAGYSWLARQSKAVNRLEKGLKRCCKAQGDVLACADQKWREVLDKFCKEEQAGKKAQFECCELGEGEGRYSCFSTRAPHPAYDRELLQQISTPQPLPTLALLCDTHKLLKKKFAVPLPVDSMAAQCCRLAPARRGACVQKKLDSLLEGMCTAEKPLAPVVTPECCLATPENPPKCLSNLLLGAITQAIQSPRFKKKKCALS